METASSFVNPSAKAKASVKKIPNWPAAREGRSWIFKQRPKIGHSPDAHKDEQRE